MLCAACVLAAVVYPPILSVLTVGVLTVGAVMRNAVGTMGVVMPCIINNFTQKFTATFSGCECHTNIEDLGQNYNFYVAFTV